MYYSAKLPRLPGSAGFLSALDIGHFLAYLFRIRSGKTTFKNFHRTSHKAFHFPFIIPILAPFPKITQSLPEKCRLNLGSAIATANNGTLHSTPQPQSLDIGRGSGRTTFSSGGSAIAKNLIANGQPTELARLVGLFTCSIFEFN